MDTGSRKGLQTKSLPEVGSIQNPDAYYLSQQGSWLPLNDPETDIEILHYRNNDVTAKEIILEEKMTKNIENERTEQEDKTRIFDMEINFNEEKR